MNQQLLDYLNEHYVVLRPLYDAIWYNSGNMTEGRDLQEDNALLSANETHEDMLFRMGEIDVDDWGDPEIIDECIDGLWSFDILTKGIDIKDLNMFEEISIPHSFNLRISKDAYHYRDNSWFYDVCKFDRYCVVENSAAHWKVFIEKKNLITFQKELAIRLLKV